MTILISTYTLIPGLNRSSDSFALTRKFQNLKPLLHHEAGNTHSWLCVFADQLLAPYGTARIQICLAVSHLNQEKLIPTRPTLTVHVLMGQQVFSQLLQNSLMAVVPNENLWPAAVMMSDVMNIFLNDLNLFVPDSASFKGLRVIILNLNNQINHTGSRFVGSGFYKWRGMFDI